MALSGDIQLFEAKKNKDPLCHMRLTLSLQLWELGGEVTSQSISVFLKVICSGLGEAGGWQGHETRIRQTGVFLAGEYNSRYLSLVSILFFVHCEGTES